MNDAVRGALFEKVASSGPVGRIGRPEEIASSILPVRHWLGRDDGRWRRDRGLNSGE